VEYAYSSLIYLTQIDSKQQLPWHTLVWKLGVPKMIGEAIYIRVSDRK
jgi:hypothetical protein